MYRLISIFDSGEAAAPVGHLVASLNSNPLHGGGDGGSVREGLARCYMRGK